MHFQGWTRREDQFCKSNTKTLFEGCSTFRANNLRFEGVSGGTVMGGQEVMLVVLRFKHLLCQDSVLVSPGSAKPLKSISIHVGKNWYHSSFRPKGARALHRSRNISITFLQSLFCYRGLVSRNDYALLVWLSVTYCTAQWWVTSACSPCSLGALTFTPNTVVLLHYSQFHILFGCFPSSTPTSTTTLSWVEMIIFSFDPATHQPTHLTC